LPSAGFKTGQWGVAWAGRNGRLTELRVREKQEAGGAGWEGGFGAGGVAGEARRRRGLGDELLARGSADSTHSRAVDPHTQRALLHLKPL
jgi:hypothetical protein